MTELEKFLEPYENIESEYREICERLEELKNNKGDKK